MALMYVNDEQYIIYNFAIKVASQGVISTQLLTMYKFSCDTFNLLIFNDA